MPCHESATLAKIKKKAQTTFIPSHKIAQGSVRQSASVGPQRSEKYGKEKTLQNSLGRQLHKQLTYKQIYFTFKKLIFGRVKPYLSQCHSLPTTT